jgi:hypothetical protein
MKQLLFILFFLPSIAYSQYLGVKLGFTNSNIPDHGMQRLTALNAGVYFQYGKDKFKVTVEPSINSKGFSFNGTITDNNGIPIYDSRINYRIKYFELPLTFGYYPVNKKVLFGINGGFAPCILINSYNGFKYGSMALGTPEIRKLNIDVFLGTVLGYNITEKLNASVNIKYGTSLGSTYNDNKNYLYNFLNCFFTVTHRI